MPSTQAPVPLHALHTGVELPVVDYDNLRNALIDNCLKAGLQPLESFLTKAIQLYEMIVVRHGLMLVGQSFGMKTSAYRMLAAALTGEGCLILQHILQCKLHYEYCHWHVVVSWQSHGIS